MTHPPAVLLSETGAALCILFALLTPAAAAGLALINAGLGRSRNGAHALLSGLCLLALAALMYFLTGFAWQGYPGGPEHTLLIGGKAWSWIGAGRFLLRGIAFDSSPASLAVLLGMFSVGLAAIIPLGAAAERWRLGASCASTAVLAGFTYPLFAHWAWGGGWLAQLGTNYHLGRGFIDSGGAGSIQVVGGLTALSITWILGPRRGKFPPQGMPAAIPAHNAVFVLFGCFLAWLGWLGLDCAGAIMFTGVEPGRATLVAVNATLAASAAVLAAMGITRARFGKADASLCANAWVGGLVASSAGCALMRPAGAVVAGAIAGALVVFSVEWLETHCRVDDPGGAVSVHAVSGLWGLLAVGLLADVPEPDQWIAQTLGVAALLGFILPLTYGLNRLLDRFRRQRVAPEGERQGLDLYELGAGAYPDFMSHKDEY
jgi:Amt family ammonium transporter